MVIKCVLDVANGPTVHKCLKAVKPAVTKELTSTLRYSFWPPPAHLGLISLSVELILVIVRQWKQQGPEAKQIASHDATKLPRFNLVQLVLMH